MEIERTMAIFCLRLDFMVSAGSVQRQDENFIFHLPQLDKALSSFLAIEALGGSLVSHAYPLHSYRHEPFPALVGLGRGSCW